MRETTSVRLATIPISGLTATQARKWLTEKARQHEAADIHLVNAYNIVLAADIVEYADLLRNASVNLADGKSISLVSRWLKRPIDQVRGPSLFVDMLADSSSDLGHYFLGGAPETLASLKYAVSSKYPAARISGAYSPPYAPIDIEEITYQAELISASGADIVWLGLGTPKQDYAAALLAPLVSRPVVCVGAAFDFVAGTRREAPLALRGLGAEWLFRLATEPKRLWRRYILGNPRFLLIAIRDIRSSRDSRS